MAKFEEAYRIGEHNEGGYAHLDIETYKGIARSKHPEWPGWVDIDHWKSNNGTIAIGHIFKEVDIPGLDQAVIAFYKNDFWDEMQGDSIVSQKFANYFYDWFINSGTVATKHLQAILSIEPQSGFFGAKTLAAVNNSGDELLDKLHASRDAFYNSHVNAVPADAKFLKGWLTRSNTLYNKIKVA